MPLREPLGASARLAGLPVSAPTPQRVSTALFHPVRTPRTFEDVVTQIVQAIRSGRLHEGDVLPGERALADRLEVSRPTVRAAIGQLAEADVLASKPGRGGGARIATIWIPEELQLRPFDSLPADEVLRLLEARRVLEPAVAQLAARHGTAEHFARLQHCIDLQRAHLDDRHKAVQAEERFHRVMWQAAHNPMLEEMLIRLLARLEVVRDMVMRDGVHMRIALGLHERTLQALTGGDRADIDGAMDEHLAYTEGLVEDVLGRRSRPA